MERYNKVKQTTKRKQRVQSGVLWSLGELRAKSCSVVGVVCIHAHVGADGRRQLSNTKEELQQATEAFASFCRDFAGQQRPFQVVSMLMLSLAAHEILAILCVCWTIVTLSFQAVYVLLAELVCAKLKMPNKRGSNNTTMTLMQVLSVCVPLWCVTYFCALHTFLCLESISSVDQIPHGVFSYQPASKRRGQHLSCLALASNCLCETKGIR